MKKYIVIPGDIELVNRSNGQPIQTIAFKNFWYDCVLADQKWNRNYEEASSARKLDKAFQKSGGQPGGVIELEVAVWEKMKDAAKTPTQGYVGFPSLAMMQVIDFVDAITGASDKAPDGFVPDNGVFKTEAEARA